MSDMRVPLDSQVSAISHFWTWWSAEGARRVTDAVRTGDYGDLVEALTTKVQAIAPDLQWELGKGDTSQHYLCVSAAGIAENRSATERWLRAAPAADESWEFRAARLPASNWADAALEFDGHSVSPGAAEVSLRIHAESYRIDVSFFHPSFGVLGEEARRRLTFLILDWVLGEDDVIRWLGEITDVDDRPADAVPVESLREVLQCMASRVQPGRWVMLQGSTPTGAPVLAMTQRPLWWIDHPTLDQHQIITLPYRQRREDGLPAPDALAELQQLEDDLVQWAEPQAMLLAHETGEGRRLLHLYSDSEDQNMSDRISSWVRRTPRATLTVRRDPGWRDLAAYT